MRRLHKLLRLSSSDRLLLLQCGMLVLGVRLGLWMLPFRVLRRILGTIEGKAVPTCPGRSELARVAWAVEGTSRVIPGATCLTKALAAQVLLHRRGLSAHLHIGVAKDPVRDCLIAHAWVESLGTVVVGGTGLGVYTPLWSCGS